MDTETATVGQRHTDEHDADPSPGQEMAALRLEVEQLEAALVSRSDIGKAQGMVMFRYGSTEEQAQRYLVRRAQAENIRVRELALAVVDELMAERIPRSP